MFKVLFLSFLFSLQFAFTAKAAEPPISDSLWKDVVEGVDYTEDYLDRDKKVDEKRSLIDKSKWDVDIGQFKYVFYVLLAGVLIYLLVVILLNAQRNQSVTADDIDITSMEVIEEKMLEIDLDKILEEALAAENYRIAFRINFLIIIKLLSLAGHIKWAKEKTNWEYFSEIKNTDLAKQFEALIINFEPIWYGELDLSKEQYAELSPNYDTLKQALQTNE